MARMSVGVLAKQFVHLLWTLCQQVDSLLSIFTVGVKTSPPSLEIGNSRAEGSQRKRKR